MPTHLEDPTGLGATKRFGRVESVDDVRHALDRHLLLVLVLIFVLLDRKAAHRLGGRRLLLVGLLGRHLRLLLGRLRLHLLRERTAHVHHLKGLKECIALLLRLRVHGGTGALAPDALRLLGTRALARILGPLLFLKPTHRRCRRILCDLGS